MSIFRHERVSAGVIPPQGLLVIQGGDFSADLLALHGDSIAMVGCEVEACCEMALISCVAILCHLVVTEL